jgi:hypothetical protein
MGIAFVVPVFSILLVLAVGASIPDLTHRRQESP